MALATEKQIKTAARQLVGVMECLSFEFTPIGQYQLAATEGGNVMSSKRTLARHTARFCLSVASPASDFLSPKHKDYLAVVAELIRQ